MIRRAPLPPHCWITFRLGPVIPADHMTMRRIEHMNLRDVRAYGMERLFPPPFSACPVPPNSREARWRRRRTWKMKHKPRRPA